MEEVHSRALSSSGFRILKDATARFHTMQPAEVRENFNNSAINNVFLYLGLPIFLDSVQIKVLYEA